MKEWLVFATGNAALIINGLALIIIFFGTIEAFFAVFRLVFSSGDGGYARRTIWLRYAHWLVAGLTFQLAADIIETAIAPSWEEIGKLAAIAVIRTFLNFFLERDLAEIRDRQRKVKA